MKTDSNYKPPSSPGSAGWSVSQTDTYGYDSAIDYLTAAGYGDELANANPTWSYDAAGNRNDGATDNLNRATTLGGTEVTNDILSNRLAKGSTSYGWDILNRMTSFTSSGITSYVYRADGMRVSKSNSSGSTSYRYDAQMGMEDVDFASNGTVSKVTDYGIGPRGIDAIYVTQSGSTTAAYPLYDAHGNMISTLSKQGAGGFGYSALRTFDAWGVIRRGAQTGDPKGRYFANLGHKQDDESGLIYRRVRFYEPASGRCVNEDAARSGPNWFAYGADNPVNFADRGGNNAVPDFIIGILLMVLGLILFTGGVNAASLLSSLVGKIQEGQIASMLRVTGISAEAAEEWPSDLFNLIEKKFPRQIGEMCRKEQGQH